MYRNLMTNGFKSNARKYVFFIMYSHFIYTDSSRIIIYLFTSSNGLTSPFT